MTAIERTWTQFPGRAYAQEELAELLPRWLPEERLGLARQLFKRSAVRQRHLVVPPGEALASGRTFADKNAIYCEVIQREVGALVDRIKDATRAPTLRSIDLLVTASCTGFQIPAMDALVIQRLGLPLDLRRVNLTEHGCAAGAASLGLAHEWLKSHRDCRALVVCAELCSLAFQPEDTSGENLVSAAIFGDGAAAVLLAGPDAEPLDDDGSASFAIKDTHRAFFPATEHFMGFDVNAQGFKIKLSQDVVRFSQASLPDLFQAACTHWGIAGPTAFATGSIHPGGRRILEILEDQVGLSRAVTRTSWEGLAEYGNLSSVSVLVALHKMVRSERALAPGALGVISAFGPGFGAELLAIERVPDAGDVALPLAA